MMEIEEIKFEYKTFDENLWLSYGYLCNLINDLRIFFENYCKSKHFNKTFATKVEENLMYLEMVYEQLDIVMEHIENIEILNLEIPQKNNIISIYKYLSYPKDYDKEITIDLNNPIDFHWNFLKNKKIYLKEIKDRNTTFKNEDS